MKSYLLILITIILGKFNFSQVTNGLILDYSFNNHNTLDESGNNNDGTPNNAELTYDRFGNPNHAYLFNGIDSRIDLPDSLVNMSSISISMWFKTTTPGRILLGHQNNELSATSSSYVPILYVRNDGRLNGQIWDGQPGNVDQSNILVTNNIWHHVVIAGDQVEQRMYIDNIYMSTSNVGVQVLANLIKNQIGNGVGGGTWPSLSSGNRPFAGEIDDIKIYDRKLTQSEVTTLFNAPNPDPTKTLAQYSFNNQNTLDESGKETDAIGTDLTLTTDRFGNADYAYEFNGTSSVMVLPNTLLQRPELTISMWFKTSSDGVLIAQQQAPVNQFSSSRVPMLYVRQDSTLNALIWDGASGNMTTNTVNLVDNQWHHVVLTGDQTGQFLFIDNVLSGSRNAVSIVGNAIYNQIGWGETGGSWQSSPSGFFPFEGSIDDILILGRRVSTAEVDSLYQMPNPLNTTEVEDFYHSEVNVYPNPFNDKLMIEMEDIQDKYYLVVDLFGKTLSSGSLNTSVIDLSTIKKGIYILQITGKDKKLVYTQKLVKN